MRYFTRHTSHVTRHLQHGIRGYIRAGIRPRAGVALLPQRQPAVALRARPATLGPVGVSLKPENGSLKQLAPFKPETLETVERTRAAVKKKQT